MLSKKHQEKRTQYEPEAGRFRDAKKLLDERTSIETSLNSDKKSRKKVTLRLQRRFYEKQPGLPKPLRQGEVSEQQRKELYGTHAP